MPNIKYIITLDSDTALVLNTGLELIGAMAHILNMPKLNEERNVVIDGYGIMQPRVGIDLASSQKTLFTKLYAGLGGTDSYTNAISDVYQDNFDEGIFAGKGIYDVKVFSDVLNGNIPENTVLSHDLLEGCFLRCGLVTDVMLMDGYPANYKSFKTRLHRWTRGDVQILGWLKNKSLNLISRYKILDNLIRAIFPVMAIISLIYFICLSIKYDTNLWPIFVLLFASVIAGEIMQIINRIIFKKDDESSQKTFNRQIGMTFATWIRAILEILLLPDKAYTTANAVIKASYRMTISKKQLLEWTTSEEADRQSKKTLISYYQSMIANVVIGTGGLIIAFISKSYGIKIFFAVLSALWLIAPFIMYILGKNIEKKDAICKLDKNEKEYLYDVGKRTWLFFKSYLNEKGNFLPPDNYQEDRKEKVVFKNFFNKYRIITC